VKFGDGPAAVIPPFSNFFLEKGTLLALMATVFDLKMGRPLKGRESQKTCLNRG
jgi:hypothetical protein